MQIIKQILFDFDGVIIDSMNVRDFGFRTVLQKHDKNLVEEFIKYHRYNAGLSRFVKIRYFYEEMLGKTIDESEVIEMAAHFSEIMKERLIVREVIIDETLEFIKRIHGRIAMHIVSGSEENELNFLCKELGLSDFFITIEGSPTAKKQLVENIMAKYGYTRESTILIGDSINDYDAAVENGLGFYGYNNIELYNKGLDYIYSFQSFKLNQRESEKR